jgi:hypothetical protein
MLRPTFYIFHVYIYLFIIEGDVLSKFWVIFSFVPHIYML